MCFTTLFDISVNPTTRCNRFYIYFVKLHVMRDKWGFIYMTTGSYVQLKENDITGDVTVCDNSEPNLQNFGGKRRQKPRGTMSRYRD